jgi:hypothetical protein
MTDGIYTAEIRNNVIRQIIKEGEIRKGMGSNKIVDLLGWMDSTEGTTRIYRATVLVYGPFRFYFTKHRWKEAGHPKLTQVMEVLV